MSRVRYIDSRVYVFMKHDALAIPSFLHKLGFEFHSNQRYICAADLLDHVNRVIKGD